MFAINWKEDSSCEVLGRITARNGSGNYTGVRGEGRYIQQADVQSIAMTLFNRTDDPDNESPVEESVSIAEVILDTPDESGEVWTKDDIGYNFRHHLVPTRFPTPGIYRLEYMIELEGGFIINQAFEGPARSVVRS